MFSKLKHNWGLLINKEVGFKYTKNNEINYFKGILKKVKVSKDKYSFVFENNILEIKFDIFSKLYIKKNNDVIWFVYDESNDNVLSGIIGFSMFDTYGFPIEMTKEILEEKGYLLDIDGYDVLRLLQKEKSQKNSKIKNVF